MPELPTGQFDGGYSLTQIDALIQHYQHCDPDSLTDEQWVLHWRRTQFVIKLLNPFSQ